METIKDLVVILAIVLNILGFLCYLILKKNNIETRYFNGEVFKNIKKLFFLSKENEKLNQKRIYLLIVLFFALLMPLFIWSLYLNFKDFIIG